MLTATVCIALSAAGLCIALLTAWRRRFLRATKWAAWSLLPVGLYMTGLLKLGGKVGRAIGDWAADLVFKPTVWAGFGVLAVAVVLFVVARLVGSRSAGRRKAAVPASNTTQAVAPAASSAALGPGPSARPEAAKKQKKVAGDDLSEFGEIEEILRRRGI